MNKKVVAGLLCLLLAGSVYADTFKHFKNITTSDYLKPFAEDVGGIIGGNDFNSGRALGFPGFDVGLSFTVQSKPNTDNKVLKDAGVDAFGIGFLNASVGLPLIGTDVMVRGFSLSGLTIIGGGLRYNIFKSGTLTKFMPDLSVSAFYDNISYDYFKGNHISMNLVASFDFPIIKPFAGFGIDKTKLEIKKANDSTLNGLDDSISKTRWTVGAKLTVLPLVYIYGAYSSLHNQSAYNAGLGVRF